jgi:ABC-type ATPase involved in cell division
MTWLTGMTDVGYTYPGGVQTLDSVSLDINRSEIVSLIGPSGCGWVLIDQRKPPCLLIVFISPPT